MLYTKTTADLEARSYELTKLMQSLSAWRNRRMSRKDRLFFVEMYREESDAILVELMKREGLVK